MSKNKLSEKYNESCIKIFTLLSMFAKGDAIFEDVIKLFADPDGKIKQKSNVLLNKYMNTLYLFGIKIEKTKGKYYLVKMPFSISLSEEELYAVSLMKSALNFISKGTQKEALQNFISELERRYDKDTKLLSDVVSATRNTNLSFYFLKFEKQIESCENYCKDGSKIEISYITNENRDETIICVPLEVRYSQEMVSFSVFNNLSRQVINIPMGKIKNIKLLKTNSKNLKTCASVVFKLKGDLAKSYKLREWETSSGIDNSGCMIVENSGEDFETLAVRLFKYHKNCEVLTPKYLKAKLVKMINNTLRNYDL